MNNLAKYLSCFLYEIIIMGGLVMFFTYPRNVRTYDAEKSALTVDTTEKEDSLSREINSTSGSLTNESSSNVTTHSSSLREKLFGKMGSS